MSKNRGLPDEYFEYQRDLESKYGRMTVGLMEVGTFYETWSYDPKCCQSEEFMMDVNGNKWDTPIGHTEDIVEILGYELTFEKPDPSKEKIPDDYGYCNPHKCGFPSISAKTNIPKILAAGYTVVKIDQVKVINRPKGKKCDHYISEVINPNLSVNKLSNNIHTNNILCLYIEYQSMKGIRKDKFENYCIVVGVSIFDVLTGKNKVSEFYSQDNDTVAGLNQLYHFIVASSPREVLVQLENIPSPYGGEHTDEIPNLYAKYLTEKLELFRYNRLTFKINTLNEKYLDRQYQLDCLNKVFNKQSAGSLKSKDNKIIHRLNLERYNYGRISYILLIEYFILHKSISINNIEKPETGWVDENDRLILTHNAIVQLDIIGTEQKRKKSKKIDSLMSVLDENCTNLGKRLLHNLLLSPLIDPDIINKYYDMVDEALNIKVKKKSLWEILTKKLKTVPDIEILSRKLLIKDIKPRELVSLYNGYIKSIDISVCLYNVNAEKIMENTMSDKITENFNDFITTYDLVFDFDELKKCKILKSESGNPLLEFDSFPFKKGIYPLLDKKYESIAEAECELNKIVEHLNTFIENTRGKKLSIENLKRKVGATNQDPVGITLQTTKSKAEKIINSDYDQNLCGELEAVHQSASQKIITSTKIAKLCDTVNNTKRKLRSVVFKKYSGIIDQMINNYNFYSEINNLIAKIDLVTCYAKISSKYNYFRPIIDTSDEIEGSYFEATELRHPIVERILNGKYVTNDVYLGNGEDKPNVIILYGNNQAGKTTCCSSVPLAIIMAQIGCFTACKLKYKTYTKIITRLSGNDDKFKGLSSFAVEMLELNTMLVHADNRTLCIADELSRGTEVKSSTCLVISAVINIIRRKSSFIFASHFHSILDTRYIKALKTSDLRICHLTVFNDIEKDLLIYDRLLENGAGPDCYGILVAKYLGLPDEFIDLAYEIMNEIYYNKTAIVEQKSSKWNKQFYADECSICGCRERIQTHHIIEQNKFGDNNWLDGINKNALDNLIGLCETCHSKLHRAGKELQVLDTSLGKLVVEKS